MKDGEFQLCVQMYLPLKARFQTKGKREVKRVHVAFYVFHKRLFTSNL